MARVDVEPSAIRTASRPSAAFADDREVGLGVQHHAQAPQHDRVVVGQE
jgi:hypothetical protein